MFTDIGALQQQMESFVAEVAGQEHGRGDGCVRETVPHSAAEVAGIASHGSREGAARRQADRPEADQGSGATDAGEQDEVQHQATSEAHENEDLGAGAAVLLPAAQEGDDPPKAAMNRLAKLFDSLQEHDGVAAADLHVPGFPGFRGGAWKDYVNAQKPEELCTILAIQDKVNGVLGQCDSDNTDDLTATAMEAIQDDLSPELFAPLLDWVKQRTATWLTPERLEQKAFSARHRQADTGEEKVEF